ncbi:Chromobox protein 3 [Xylographa trunciseda]|nr:Chromobox protein 3 [Xylographa trunciseda]
MPIRFSDLPTELRQMIFELAISQEPRVVEICAKDGVVYSKAPPPPLLHVNQESRAMILGKYKPWLPRFKGTRLHEPWAKLVGKLRPGNPSCLDNVCINMHIDTLLIDDKSWSTIVSLFQIIDRYHLRSMALNMTGWRTFQHDIKILQSIKMLTHIYMFDDNHYEKNCAIEYKALRIQCGLHGCEERDKKKPKKRVPHYITPKIIGKYVSAKRHSLRKMGKIWTTYKYQVGSTSTYEGPTVLSSFVALEDRCNDQQTRESGKRKADEKLVESCRDTGRVSKKRKVSRTMRPNNDNFLGDKKNSAILTKHYHARSTFQPLVPAPLLSRPYCSKIPDISKSAVSIPTSTPRVLKRHRNSIYKTHDDLHNPPLPVSPLLLARSMLSSSMPARSRASKETGRSSSSTVPPRFRFPPRPSQQFMDQSDSDSDDHHIESTTSMTSSMPNVPASASESRCVIYPDAQDTVPHILSCDSEIATRYVPEAFLAERTTPDNTLEILVRWESYPDEGDWTWEPETSLREDVPDMVDAWKEKGRNGIATPGTVPGEVVQHTIHDVKAIIKKRTIKGVLHYLVRWQGYPLAKHNTWEPEARLRVDVPDMVEAFERGQ